MTLTADKLIEEFYETIKEQYPDLNYEKIEKICKLPFYYIKSLIESTSFPLIHIKFLGKFLVYPGKVQVLMRLMNRKLKEGKISKEEHQESVSDLQNYLIKNNEEVPEIPEGDF